MKQLLCAGAIMTLFMISCKKNDNPDFNASVKADLSVEFDNVAGSSDLQLNTGVYTNASNEALTITKLKYYISNFVLTAIDGTSYVVPQDSCYFLIDESDEETHEPVIHVPEGEYKAISFLIGVDSLRNTKDISERTGVLDPVSAGGDMYWGWNSGYIFFKMEGTSPVSPEVGNIFMYHIGGFGGYSSKTLNNLKTISLDLTARGTPKVKAGKETNIHLFVDILKVFDGTQKISIAANPVVMFEDLSVDIAGNYTSMIRHDHTEN
jgi:hypothetical protein